MGKFCGKCGGPLDKKGKCPKCDGVKPSAIASLDPKTYKIIVTCLWSFLALLTVTAIIICLVVFWPKSSGDSSDKKTTETVSNNADTSDDNTGKTDTVDDADDPDLSTNYEVPDFDAETYYNDNSDLKDTFDVATSQGILSESDAYQLLDSLGFYNIELIFSYDTSGNYLGEEVASYYSSDLHPMYTMQYLTPDGNEWQLLIVNNSIFAIPEFYNYSGSAKAMLILSETETITSYDRGSNKFYVNIPKNNDLAIKKVDSINAELLNTLTAEDLDNL